MLIKVRCFSQVLTKLTHAMGISGNESILNKEKVFHDNSIKEVPVLSGNALRHKLVREPGAMFLVDQLGLNGELTVSQANFLLVGGGLTQSSIYDNLKKIAELQELFPLIKVLGGCLPDQIVGGNLFVLYGILVCEENRERLNNFLPQESQIEADLYSFENFVTNYQYTRGDIAQKSFSTEWLEDAKSQEGEKEKGKSGLMIYNGQAIMPGACFYHEFILENVTPLDFGALLHALQMWENGGATIGGSRRIGHGKLSTEVMLDFEDGKELDAAECVMQYVEYVNKNKEKCVQWLMDNFKG